MSIHELGRRPRKSRNVDLTASAMHLADVVDSSPDFETGALILERPPRLGMIYKTVVKDRRSGEEFVLVIAGKSADVIELHERLCDG